MTWAENWLRERHTEADAAESAVIAAMLSRPGDMQYVYRDIERQVPEGAPNHRHYVLDTLLGALNQLYTAEFSKARDAVQEADRINRQIAGKLTELADLFKQRAQVTEDYGITGNDPHIVDAIADALDLADARTKHLGRWHVLPRLERIRFRYDLKYWPPSALVLKALAEAHRQEVEPADVALADALDGYKGAERDAIRLMLTRVDELKHPVNAPVDDTDSAVQPTPPIQFTDRAVAALLNVAGFEVDSDRVKKTRQRR